MKVQWSRQARKDLKAIHAYIARDSLIYAQGQVARIIDRVERAATRPTAGHPVHEQPELPLREVHEGSYRIIYAFDDRDLQVVTIVHMRQQLVRKRLE
ncbi:MAG: type II toxin-antitoxin system RelE/ParE family toxin [Verrucomicrobiota bacterium]